MRGKGMEYMEGYGNETGYKPPSGNAGRAAKGEYSHEKNPLTVPKKGSSIRSGEATVDRMRICKRCRNSFVNRK